MNSFILFIIVFAFASGCFLMGNYAENKDYSVKAKKDDCEKALILRAHECKPYYLTTEEIKLIERLGENQ